MSYGSGAWGGVDVPPAGGTIGQESTSRRSSSSAAATASASSALGRDVSTLLNGDLDPAFRWISGQRTVAERVARRLYTDVDLLEYAPDGCVDIRAFLSGGVDNATLLRLASRIAAIAERDESVATADATVSWNDATQALKVRIALETAEGPFALVLAITALTLELLGVE